MFFVLSKSLDLAVSPIVWVIALITAALVMIARRSPHRRRIVACLVGAIVVLLVFGNPTVADRIWTSLEEDAPSSYDGATTYDAVVLLGGVTPDGMTMLDRPSYNDNVERLLVVFDLLRANKARHVVISGGVHPRDARFVEEASALAAQLQKWGIDKQRIVVDDEAQNTRQNATETARIAKERGFGKLLIVTSAFHMHRALGCFRAVGLDVDALPVDYRTPERTDRDVDLAPRTSALDRSGDAFRELLGRAVYRALGYAERG